MVADPMNLVTPSDPSKTQALKLGHLAVTTSGPDLYTTAAGSSTGTITVANDDPGGPLFLSQVKLPMSQDEFKITPPESYTPPQSGAPLVLGPGQSCTFKVQFLGGREQEFEADLVYSAILVTDATAPAESEAGGVLGFDERLDADSETGNASVTFNKTLDDGPGGVVRHDKFVAQNLSTDPASFSLQVDPSGPFFVGGQGSVSFVVSPSGSKAVSLDFDPSEPSSDGKSVSGRISISAKDPSAAGGPSSESTVGVLGTGVAPTAVGLNYNGLQTFFHALVGLVPSLTSAYDGNEAAALSLLRTLIFRDVQA